jgi:ABC-type antimicrobial peptide transport system permease subunit
MLKNYFKTALRNLWKRKGFSAINIVGLAIGMASAMLILLWVQNEMSYDRFYKKSDRLYIAYNKDIFDGEVRCWNTTPKILVPTLKKDYPEVEAATRVNWNFVFIFKIGEKTIKAGGTMTDPAFLTMFDLPMLQGNPKTALNNTYSIVLTAKMARKLFGNEDPMNKTVKVDNRDNFTVTGVLKDLPYNTAMDFEYILPWTYVESRGWSDSSWGNNSTTTYVLLKSNTTIDRVNAHIRDIGIKRANFPSKTEVFLYPFSSQHLYSNFENGKPSGGRISTVRVFIIIAGFILLIACINFMNLSTARSEKRAKEVGIRKVVGAEKQSLIGQFLIESILIALIAGIIATGIVELFLPSFNTLTKKQLFIDFKNLDFWLAGLGFILFTGILAGSYPAFFLSAFRPVVVLKGSFKKPHALVTPRKILVILQFTFAIILIISTIVIQKQIKYAQDREIGYARNNLAYIFLEGDIEKNYEPIKNEMLGSGAVNAVSKTSAPMTEGWSNTWGIGWEGKDTTNKIIIDRFCSDGNLVKTTGMKVVEGRDIDLKSYITDSTACLINESALRLMGFKHPIGQILKDNGENWHIVGVVQDFILRSPYEPTKPMVIEGAKAWFNVIHIRFNDHRSMRENLAKVEQVFRKYNPAYPFLVSFIDEAYQKKFADEEQIRTLASLFAGLTIFISCLGLFGLASYMAENRIREIGIRKVMGASVTSITTLLSKEFLKLVLISILFAVPIAWWSMHVWLGAYSYRTPLSAWIFLAAGALSIFIALLTVSSQSIRAALSNPVRSLKTE